MPFKMHKIMFFFSRKKYLKKYACHPYLKMSDPLPETHLFFFIWPYKERIKGGLCVSIDCYSAIFPFFKIKAFKQRSLFSFRKQVIRLNTKVIKSV